MALLDTINLDFHVISTGDPKVLVVMDTSVWGFIEGKRANIEITPPASDNTKKFTFVKGKTNVFNSSNLLLSNVGDYKNLSDGIWRIDLLGAHGHCKHRDYLKTDKARLELAKIYIELGTDENSDRYKEKKKILQDAELMIRSAEHSVSRGELSKGMMYFKKAMSIINNYNDCKECKQ